MDRHCRYCLLSSHQFFLAAHGSDAFALQSDRLARIGLWTAAVLVTIAVIFPQAARHFL